MKARACVDDAFIGARRFAPRRFCIDTSPPALRRNHTIGATADLDSAVSTPFICTLIRGHLALACANNAVRRPILSIAWRWLGGFGIAPVRAVHHTVRAHAFVGEAVSVVSIGTRIKGILVLARADEAFFRASTLSEAH